MDKEGCWLVDKRGPGFHCRAWKQDSLMAEGHPVPFWLPHHAQVVGSQQPSVQPPVHARDSSEVRASCLWFLPSLGLKTYKGG